MDYSKLAMDSVKLPFIKKYQYNNKELLVFGSYHTNDFNDSQIQQIEDSILNFKPDVILFEGDNISFDSTKRNSVSYYFEMGLVRYLANKQSIPDINLEPPLTEQYDSLLKYFPKEQIVLAEIGKQITLFLVQQRKKDEISSSIEGWLKEMKIAGFNIDDSETTYSFYTSCYKKVFNREFNIETYDYRITEPKHNVSEINKVIQFQAMQRDAFMLNTITNCLNKYDKVYVQIGGAHAFSWQKALTL